MTTDQGLRLGKSERGQPLLERLLLPGLDVAGEGGADGDRGRVGQRGTAAVPERRGLSRGLFEMVMGVVTLVGREPKPPKL